MESLLLAMLEGSREARDQTRSSSMQSLCSRPGIHARSMFCLGGPPPEMLGGHQEVTKRAKEVV